MIFRKRFQFYIKLPFSETSKLIFISFPSGKPLSLSLSSSRVQDRRNWTNFVRLVLPPPATNPHQTSSIGFVWSLRTRLWWPCMAARPVAAVVILFRFEFDFRQRLFSPSSGHQNFRSLAP
ncbi:hypothetical protein RchiOBHm_Chr2g0167981 [Rosa chinensis]|uniref:Uncharacterized protein n=1 Tax=Rosa chinensis TaxID=74649 RepID=A0A2P6S4G1_ROSCH|nr:hypothetical protein RchiOBHm_Chr2g0167981 [Rosa chinensis]